MQFIFFNFFKLIITDVQNFQRKNKYKNYKIFTMDLKISNNKYNRRVFLF